MEEDEGWLMRGAGKEVVVAGEEEKGRNRFTSYLRNTWKKLDEIMIIQWRTALPNPKYPDSEKETAWRREEIVEGEEAEVEDETWWRREGIVLARSWERAKEEGEEEVTVGLQKGTRERNYLLVEITRLLEETTVGRREMESGLRKAGMQTRGEKARRRIEGSVRLVTGARIVENAMTRETVEARTEVDAVRREIDAVRTEIDAVRLEIDAARIETFLNKIETDIVRAETDSVRAEAEKVRTESNLVMVGAKVVIEALDKISPLPHPVIGKTSTIAAIGGIRAMTMTMRKTSGILGIIPAHR